MWQSLARLCTNSIDSDSRAVSLLCFNYSLAAEGKKVWDRDVDSLHARESASPLFMLADARTNWSQMGTEQRRHRGR